MDRGIELMRGVQRDSGSAGELLDRLRAHVSDGLTVSQSHLLAHWDRLSPSQRESLGQEILSIDFLALEREVIGGGIEGQSQVDWCEVAGRAESPEAVRLATADLEHLRRADEQGSEAIAAGKVAMILVAGGQGTRLGFDQPKGMFPIGPVSGRTLFQMHVDSLRGAMRRFGVSIPLLIMTGPSTDGPTREYFQANGNLGLGADELIFFEQGTMPAIDAESGRVLMDSLGGIALSPDGHGGILRALEHNGLLEWAQGRGIEHFFYAQVDNPLVRACDPRLIGLHRLAGSQVTTQVVPKRFPTERVGNVVKVDGKTQIIEYSDLPEVVASQRNEDGTLKLWAGNIAVHVFDVSFLKSCVGSRDALPFHRAKKVVSYVDVHGELQQPAEPNAIKLERFVFDLLPAAERTLVVEVLPSESFAPVKNATGAATDTPEASRQAISGLHQRWLQEAGVEIHSGVQVEIHPMWAWDAAEVLERISEPVVLKTDTYFA